MKYSIAVCATMIALTNAFVVNPSSLSFAAKTVNAKTVKKRIHPLRMATEDDETPSNTVATPGIDKAWRHVKKPMLRIGGKGLTETHGNSLIELLNAHTAVKVKVNTKRLGSLEDAFKEIKDLTEKSGKIKGIELIHIRPSDNVILFGKEGTLDSINAGDFPPPPPPPYVPGQKREKNDEEEEDSN
jgi:RNA-binding protein YhbY